MVQIQVIRYEFGLSHPVSHSNSSVTQFSCSCAGARVPYFHIKELKQAPDLLRGKKNYREKKV